MVSSISLVKNDSLRIASCADVPWAHLYSFPQEECATTSKDVRAGGYSQDGSAAISHLEPSFLKPGSHQQHNDIKIGTLGNDSCNLFRNGVAAFARKVAGMVLDCATILVTFFKKATAEN